MSGGKYVLVGLGYDEDGRPELDWAANEALARETALRVVRAYDPAEFIEYWTAPPAPSVLEELRGDNEQTLEAALAHTRRQWPELVVHGHIAEGSAAQLLVETSREAALTVVGSRQLSTVGAMALGSVSSTVIAMADGPVVVVGNRVTEPVAEPAVVLGVDGSVGMPAALEFAFEYADRHHRPVRAVSCWHHDLLEVTPWPQAHDGPGIAETWLADTLIGWQHKYPNVPVRRDVVHEHPVAGLVAASAGHDLLVVGSHGQHAVARIGSVSQGVLHHARCPVAVVHPRGGTT